MRALKSALVNTDESHAAIQHSTDKPEHLRPIGLEVNRIPRLELLLLIDVELDRERGDLRLLYAPPRSAHQDRSPREA